jgi:hypothetical protein
MKNNLVFLLFDLCVCVCVCVVCLFFNWTPTTVASKLNSVLLSNQWLIWVLSCQTRRARGAGIRINKNWLGRCNHRRRRESVIKVNLCVDRCRNESSCWQTKRAALVEEEREGWKKKNPEDKRLSISFLSPPPFDLPVISTIADSGGKLVLIRKRNKKGRYSAALERAAGLEAKENAGPAALFRMNR